MSGSSLPAAPGAATSGLLRRRRLALPLPAVLVTVALATFLLSAARLLTIGAGDLGIAGLFSTDEELAGQLLQSMIRKGNLGLSHFFSYGPLDLDIARAVLVPFGFVYRVDAEVILVSLRLVSLVSAAGVIATTYLLGRRLWDAWTGALAAALVASSATVLAWSTTAHPDMLQLLWLTLGILVVVELPARPAAWRAALAAACAALAFASKYGGAFLLPALWLGLALPAIAGEPRTSAVPLRRRLAVLLGKGAVSLAVFALVFLALDPTILREPREFVFQFRLESSLAHRGHLRAVGLNPLGWAHQLAAPEVLGPAALVLALAALLCYTAADIRALAASLRIERTSPPLASARRLPLELWVLGYLALLLLWVGDIQPRYALPILPPLALLAAAGLCWLVRRSPARAPLAAVLLIAVYLPVLIPAAGFERSQLLRMHGDQVADRLAAGRWLAVNVDPSAPILRDAYSYVPDAFTNTQETFGLTREEIDSFSPRIIVTDAAIRNRFRNPAEAAAYAGGVAAYDESFTVYQTLEAGGLPCYSHLQHFGPVDIYGTLAPGSTADRC